MTDTTRPACTVPGCSGTANIPAHAAPTTCTVPGCDAPLRNRKHGLCNRHYHALRRYGTPTPVLQPARGRTVAMTDNMLEDLWFMAEHGEHSHGAAARLSQHTETTVLFTRDSLLDALRNRGHSELAARLVEADPLPDTVLDGGEVAGRVLGLKAARAERKRKVAA